MSKVVLQGITWDHPRGWIPLIKCSDLYKSLFGIDIKWKKRSLANFGDQSLTAMAGQYDLLIIDHPHAGVACEKKCLFPLDGLLPQQKLNQLREQSAGPSFSSYSYKGKQWALPVDGAMQCSAIRPDLMAALPVPKNWPEVFRLTEGLKEKKLQVGMALSPTDSLCSFLTLTAQFGSPVREGNEMLVSGEAGLQSLELMRRMRDSFHANSLDWNPIQLYDYMATYDDVAYVPLAFCYTNYSREGFRKNNLVYGNAPGINNAVLGGAGIAVSAKSRYPAEAAQYAGWICSAEIQNSIYIVAQGQPANLMAWKSNTANEITNNFFINTIDTLTNAFVRPRYSGWPAFQKYLGEVLHAYLKDDADPVKTLNHLQQVYRLSYLENK